MARTEPVAPGWGTTSSIPATVTTITPPIADPAPLGLAAFALTTFLLSVQNAGLTDGPDAWLGFALAYGGLIQLLAGMWEFRNRNVFGATAFSTYGGFWIGLGLWFLLVAPTATSAAAANSDLGWILLAFGIFNTYMLLWSTQVSVAVFLVFLTLEANEIVLVVGFFSGNANIIKAGGWAGVVTAAVAWYASAAGVINGMKSRHVLPVGSPMGRTHEQAAAPDTARVDRTAA
ncbi:MAG TPA: acetate uptake transporter [Actinomycetota bacterium]|nr:acetate uptake transporter [Actinomycetota bacterium]